ncbi:Ecm8p KABA2_12S00462 [Maudiozyma barnettii]|uniref:Transcription regulator Rua1 C-terminal domain-containing protein n=1 Tax=Maudiozyma barnettii TaxID=61262 RepID=A0A8H2VK88_9SACH|nr:Ecm8p [Kazachstania barnettii]CAB4256845.1 similar to Saccharomyces cerevisiae YBR076W ECM8 Non-essential protein of unknown function [Kazachstania barnettii]
MLEEKEELLNNRRIFNDITNISTQTTTTTTTTTPTNKLRLLNKSYNINEGQLYCKDNSQTIKKENKVYLPRVFQHHDLPDWLIQRYKDKDRCDIFINCNFNGSPCNTIRGAYCDAEEENIVINKSQWIEFKYCRKYNSINQILCRFCYGKNWIEESFIYEHLFGSHGIVTNNNSSSNKIRIRLLPLPQKYQINEISNKTKTKTKTKNIKIQVLCKECEKWIKLNSSNSSSSTKETIEYRQLHGIRGFYENYFRHYISCNSSEHNQIHFISNK